MFEDQPNSLPPLNSASLAQHDENHQSLPPVFNFPEISGEKFNSSFKEDPSKTSSHSTSNVFNAIYPQIPDNSTQEVHQLKKKPLNDLTNIRNLYRNPQQNVPDKNLKNAQNQIPFRILEGLDNFNQQSNFSSKSFHPIDSFINPQILQSLETKQKDYKMRTKNDPKSSFYPDTQTSFEKDFSQSSIQPDETPIPSKGSPSNSKDVTPKDLDLSGDISGISEGGADVNTEAEDVNDVTEIKETVGKLKDIIDQKHLPEWLQLSQDVRELAIMGKIKEAYDKWMMKRNLWENYAEKFNSDFYRVNYCLTFIQYLGYMFKEALPKLIQMEEFYDKEGNKQDLGDKDIGYLYNEIGKCYSMIGGKGYKDLAEEYLAMAKTRLKKCPEERLFILIHCYSTHGEHFLKYKDYNKAQRYFEKVLKLTQGLSGKGRKYGEPPKNCLLGWAYIDLADVLISQRDFVGGERNLTLAIEKLTDGNLLDSFFRAQVKRNQARLSKNVEDSVRLYEEALRILKDTLPEGNQLEKEYQKECEKVKGKGLKIVEGTGEP